MEPLLDLSVIALVLALLYCIYVCNIIKVGSKKKKNTYVAVLRREMIRHSMLRSYPSNHGNVTKLLRKFEAQYEQHEISSR